MSTLVRPALHGEIRLNGEDIDLLVGDALVSLKEDLSIAGSSVVRLVLFDPGRTLITSGLLDLHRDDADRLGREVELRIDGTYYWLRHVAKQGDMFTLTFEDRTIAKMREKRGRMKVADAAAIGDRRFLARLCKLAGVPDLIADEPTEGEQQARKRAGIGVLRAQRDQDERDRRRKPGLADTARLNVKGEQATGDQLRIASRLLTVAAEMNAGPKATLALILAAIVESTMSNPSGGHGNSAGVLQAWVGRARGADGTVRTVEEARDVEYMAKSFLIDKAGYGFTGAGGAKYLERTRPELSAAQIAQAVQGSAFPDRYGLYEAEGRAIVEAFTGGTGLPGAGAQRSYAYTVGSPLTVGRDESYWDAALRTAEERNARFFVVRNQPYYMRDETLMRSRPRVVLAEGDAGIDWIDWEWAPHKRLRRTDVTARAEAWQAPIGSVVLLDASCGPAGGTRQDQNRGRWLVGAYQRDRTGLDAQITLQKGRRPKTPTTEVELQLAGRDTARGLPGDLDAGGVPDEVLAALAEAYRISRKNYPYVWGGGHARAGTPDGGTGRDAGVGFDCSGYVGACLAAAGLAYAGSSVPASGTMAGTLGRAGEGRYLTVWANAAHVYIEFRLPRGVVVRADTSGSPSGPHVRRGARSNAGFNPRHFEGL